MLMGLEFKVGFRVQGSGFEVHGLEFRVQGKGVGIRGVGMSDVGMRGVEILPHCRFCFFALWSGV